jgi:DNA-binding IclR family transcriptional regulator
VPRRLERCTESTIVDRAALHRELAAVRADGVALDREEHTLGIAAIAVAVLDPVGPVAAISIPTPAERFAASEPRLRAALLSARAAAEEILGR